MNDTAAVIDVPIGEIRVARGPAVLEANALGSCIAVALYDPFCRVGGMAHVMLPGAAPRKEHAEGRQYRYAKNAVDNLVQNILAAGGRRENLVAFAAGGGNVLGRADDTICADCFQNYVRQRSIGFIE